MTRVLRRIFRSCFHYRSRIFIYLTNVAGGFVWEGQRKGVRGEWSACTRFARAIAALLRFSRLLTSLTRHVLETVKKKET